MNMTRRAFLGACGISIAFSQSRTRPNIVFILSEDHHFQAAGFAGNPKIQTPNLDELAKRGTVFSNAISSSPQCAPSRGILLTGLEPFRTGVLSNHSRRFTTPAVPTVIAQLKSNGYETSLIGKWQTPNAPSDLGFSNAPLWVKTNDQSEPPYLMLKGMAGKETLKADDANEAFTQAAVDYFPGVKQKPFFLFLSMLSSRLGLPIEDKFLQRYKGQQPASLAPPDQDPEGKKFGWKRYYANISKLDDCVGRVVAALEKSGELANTILFFSGDNGFLCGSHGKVGKVYPWEAALRVPMFATGAGVKKGNVIDAPVSTSDLPATWLALAGVKPVASLAGRSLRSTLETGKPVTDESFALWCEPEKEYGRGLEPYRIVRTRTHKLIQWQSGGVELYEWPNDPHENRNLAGDPSSQKVLGQLKRKLEARMAERKDPFLAPGPAGD